MTQKRHKIGTLADARGTAFSALALLAQIRAAVGDPTGRMMQDELIEHCRSLAKANQDLSALSAMVAPIVVDYCRDTEWCDLGGGYIRGAWHEDGSPYEIKCPPQLVPAMLTAQKICTIASARHENRA